MKILEENDSNGSLSKTLSAWTYNQNIIEKTMKNQKKTNYGQNGNVIKSKTKSYEKQFEIILKLNYNRNEILLKLH